MLDAKIIRKKLIAANIELNVLDSVDSTNAYLARQPLTDTFTVCIAEQQTDRKSVV